MIILAIQSFKEISSLMQMEGNILIRQLTYFKRLRQILFNPDFEPSIKLFKIDFVFSHAERLVKDLRIFKVVHALEVRIEFELTIDFVF